MQARVISIPFRREFGDFDDGELVRWLEGHDATYVREFFFFGSDGQPALACFVQWTGQSGAPVDQRPNRAARAGPPGEPCGRSGPASGPASGRFADSVRPPRSARDKSRPAIALDEAGLRVRAALKVWRTERARELGVPVFRVLTNRQLDALARSCPTSLEALESIEGFGPATLRSHGSAIVALTRSVRVPITYAERGATVFDGRAPATG